MLAYIKAIQEAPFYEDFYWKLWYVKLTRQELLYLTSCFRQMINKKSHFQFNCFFNIRESLVKDKRN